MASRSSTTQARPALTAGLLNLLERAANQARAQQRPVLVSRTLPIGGIDPIAFFDQGGATAGQRHFWAVPERDFYLVGVGGARTFTAAGPDHFNLIAEQWRHLLDGAVLDMSGDASVNGIKTIGTRSVGTMASVGTRSGGDGPLLMGGFAFDPLRPSTPLWAGFPDGAMTLPRFQLASAGGAQWLTVNVVITPADEPASVAATVDRAAAALSVEHKAAAPAPDRPENLKVTDIDPAGWQAAVAAAAALIRAGELEKVVLAREVLARADHPIGAAGALASLMERYPSCFVFAVANDDHCFLGASPEQLVQLQGDQVQLMGLAGTARRDDGTELDRQLGEALLANPKEREEHAVVVRAIRELLAPLCSDLSMPDTPTLLRVHNVQHLLTPITAKIIPPHTLLDLVAQLHPTPAVGGFPREQALAVIRELELLDRGWYAAPIGWVDGHGSGEFTVAIRSALIRGNEASLFAGCGIMGDSDPAAEFEESRYKLRPMLRALAAGVAVGGTA